jgi:hypothetical protein
MQDSFDSSVFITSPCTIPLLPPVNSATPAKLVWMGIHFSRNFLSRTISFAYPAGPDAIFHWNVRFHLLLECFKVRFVETILAAKCSET